VQNVCPLTLVVLGAAKDLADRSDTGRVAGVRSFAALRQPLGIYPSHACENARTAFAIHRYSAAADAPAKPAMGGAGTPAR
jgi:hypothetical protein